MRWRRKNRRTLELDQAVARAEAERVLSEHRLAAFRATVVHPNERIAEHNQFIDMIRQTIIPRNGKQAHP